MTIVSFSFTKIVAEKKSSIQGKVQIQNNIAIKEITKTDIALGKNTQKGLKYVFEYIARYEPKIGEISLTGEIIAIEDEKVIEKVFEDWKKEKKVAKDVLDILLNQILTKSNIEALLMSREINLPPSMPMQKVKFGMPK